MVNNKTSRSTNSLSKLMQLFTRDETGLESYIYPKLTFGDIWWVPDSITGFSPNKEQHPWVIINGYTPSIASITACPRTSSFGNRDLKRGILTLANVMPGLERNGVFLLSHKRALLAKQFRDYTYIGKLPDEIINEIKKFYSDMANGKIK